MADNRSSEWTLNYHNYLIVVVLIVVSGGIYHDRLKSVITDSFKSVLGLQITRILNTVALKLPLH